MKQKPQRTQLSAGKRLPSRGLRSGIIGSVAFLAVLGLGIQGITPAGEQPWLTVNGDVVVDDVDAQDFVIHDIATATTSGPLAHTKTEMSEAVAPEGYAEGGPQTLAAAESEQEQVVSADDEATARELRSENDTEELAIVRQPITSPVVVFGVTLPKGEVVEQAVFSYRTLKDNKWSEWVEIEAAEVDPAVVNAGRAVPGSEPQHIVGVEMLEVVARKVDGTAIPGAVLNILDPYGHVMPEAVAIEGKESTQDAPVAEQSAVSEELVGEDQVRDSEVTQSRAVLFEDVTAGALAVSVPSKAIPGGTYVTSNGVTVTSRAGWGADESWVTLKEKKETKFEGVVIHHTAGHNDYTRAQVPGIVKGIFHYHARTLGWDDLGYHILIDKFGGVWEGRQDGLLGSTKGAHARAANSKTFGVSVMGNYSNVAPSQAALDSLAKITAWKLDHHGINDLNKTITIEKAGSAQKDVTVGVVSAHRNVGATACPGDAFYAQFPAVINSIKSEMAKIIAAKPAEPTSTETTPAPVSAPTPAPAPAPKPVPAAPAGQPYVVNATQLNIRQAPTTASARIGTLRRNQSVTVVGSTNGWYGLSTGGWVSSKYLTAVRTQRVTPAPAPAPAQPKEVPAGQTYVVTASQLNIRQSPTTASARIGSLRRNQNVTVVESRYGWYRLSTDGWVSAQYLRAVGAPAATPSPSPTPAPRAQTASQGRAMTATANVNLRKGPSTSHAKVGMLVRGQKVTVVETNNGWHRLANGVWVSGRYLR